MRVSIKSVKSAMRPIATWALLYVYASSAMLACAPPPSGRTPGEAPIGHQRLALPPDFLTTYRLQAPTADGINGGLRGQTPFGHRVSVDGQLEIDVPLDTPPGRNGVEPQLALSYGHRRGEGYAGRMWDISGLSRIHRCNKTKAFDGAWSEQAGSELCLNGQRLIRLPPTSDLQTIDGMTKVTSLAPAPGFATRERDGSKRKFTVTLGSPTAATEFLMTSLEDAWGNTMTYSYNADGSPHSIAYTSNGTTAANRFVDFTYEPRAASKASRATGGEIVVVADRLKTVTMAAPGDMGGGVAIVRRYHVSYENTDPNEIDDTVTSVTECIPTSHQFGRTQTPTERCYEPAMFMYEGTKPSFGSLTPLSEISEFPQVLDARQLPTDPSDFLMLTSIEHHLNSMAVVDVDGDNILDIVFMNAPATNYLDVGRCEFGHAIQARWFVKKGQRIGSTPTFLPAEDLGLPPLTIENAGFPPRAIDMNGDGVSELLGGVTARCDGQPVSGKLELAIHTRDANGALTAGAPFPAHAMLGDVNGDALPDVTFINRERVQHRTEVSFLRRTISGTLGISLNNSSPATGTISLGSPSALLPFNTCESTIAPTCSINNGPETTCNVCADGFLAEVPLVFVNSACQLPGDCPATGYVVETRSPPPSSPVLASRVSSVAKTALIDTDGNGVPEVIFREAVPSNNLKWGNNQVAPTSDLFGMANAEDGTPITPELPGKTFYAARLSGSNFVRTRLNVTEAIALHYDQPESTRFTDLNGDGLADWLAFGRQTLTARLNTGNGVFGAAITVDVSEDVMPGGSSPRAQLGDVDADGRPDVILPLSSRVFDLSGAEWRERPLAQPQGTGAVLYYSGNGTLIEAGDLLVANRREIYADLDSDGDVDVIGLNQFGVGVATGEARQPKLYYSKNSAKRKLLKSARSGPRSVTVGIERFSATTTPCASPLSCIAPEGLTVATSTTETDEDGQNLVTTYKYSDSRTDLLGHGWLGFGRRTISIAARGVRREESYPNSTPVISGQCAGCYWYPGARRANQIVTTRDSRGGHTAGVGQIVMTVDNFEFADERNGQDAVLVSYLKRHAVTESVGVAPSGQTSAPTFTPTSWVWLSC